MGYTEKYTELEKIFDPEAREIMIPGSRIRIVNNLFLSDELPPSVFSENDFEIKENRTFSYPVFIPEDPGSNKAILLLHGLNERSWSKYLTWAFTLAEQTNSYVILFPISFHINRSPVSWKDPRSMLNLLKEKNSTRGEIRSSCFANIALSNRLSDDPRRFLKSGYQTVCDLTLLMKQISSGDHLVIPGRSRVDIFAYSIGAFLAEILMISDPEGLFSESKLFMFCGGSVFSNMQGESKLIMDKLAYDRVYNYYMEGFENEIVEKKKIPISIVNGKAGMAFRSMIDFGRFGALRQKAFARFRDQIFSIGLKQDLVIPADGIRETLKTGSGSPACRMDVLDFPYRYCHENPFPVLRNVDSSEVDRCFDIIFGKAVRFLC